MPLLSRRQGYRNPAIKDPAAEVTAEGNLRIRQPAGLQQANRRRRLALWGIMAANRMRLNAWPQPFDPTVHPGEVTFTELERVAGFTEIKRNVFGELDRGSE